VLSVIALPAIWLANRDESRQGTTAPNVAAVGLEAGVDPESSAAVPQPADPLEPVGSPVAPLFLNGPAVGPGPDHVAVATAEPEGESRDLEATFRRGVGSVDSCRVNGIPAGLLVTVTNLENGRSVECWTGPTSIGRADEIALHTDRYREIARFSDAPVHVEVTW
jgi:hypothetical protein